MRIQTNDEKKIVTIWLTNDDQANPSCSEILDPILKDWKAKKYFPVIFCSGAHDLYDTTAGLLLHNRDASVKKEIAAEKAAKA